MAHRRLPHRVLPPHRQPQPARAVRVLLTVLADLARTLADLRAAQARRLQAAAAVAAAARLAGVAATIDYGESIAHLAATSFPLPPQTTRPAPASGSAPRRSGPVTSQGSPRRPRRGT